VKFTHSWLSDFVQTTLTPTEIAAELTMLGFEVESQHSTTPPINGVVVAKVLACEAHPKSDHLKICKVDAGGEPLTVICGAPNVAVNQLVAFAGPGTVLPNGLRIEKKTILGVESSGMICSEAELGLSDDADGILVLDTKAKIGNPLSDFLKPDTVFEINVTPNRPDCLGIIGVAREIAALTQKPLLIPKPKFLESTKRIDTSVKVLIKDVNACPRYAARLIENVRIGPSPKWLAERLRAVGIRPILNIVDVTNYVLMETGQPLHAFDFANIQGSQIIVRKARPGEIFQTLDEKTHTLQESDLLICDGERSVGLAGVMGGLNSEVTSNTKDVLLECAYFEPLGIRKTAKRLSINSEASRRFERGVDPNGIPYALGRATELILATAGGTTAARSSLDVYPKKIKPKAVVYRPERANQVIGKKIREQEMALIFKRLQLTILKQKTGWRINVPTFRPDLTREIDLIEEVARVYGYDRIEPSLRTNFSLQTHHNVSERAAERIRNLLTGLGFFEAVTVSLLAPREAKVFLPEQAKPLEVLNPLSEELSTMRPSLLATLLSSTAYNLNRKIADFWLFEIGSVFWRDQSGSVVEKRRIGAVITGAVIPQSWRDQPRPFSSADVKGVLEVFAERMRLPAPIFEPVKNSSHLVEGWEISFGGERLGSAGLVNEHCRALYGIDAGVYSFELDLDFLLKQIDWSRHVKPIPRYPAVERDISFVVDESVPAGKIDELIKTAGGDFLEKQTLFDLYSGSQVPPGKKSMTYSLNFRAPDRTLREAEIDGWQKSILQALEQNAGAMLRT
jgi:phenylalanyl-tRNA synthetase beta chain